MTNSILLMLLFFSIQWIGAQEISEEFKNTVDSVIQQRPLTFSEINEAVGSHRRDTTYMRYFNIRAAQEKYPYGQAYSLNQLGTKYRNISQYARALQLHQEALNIAKESESIEFEIFSLNMLGVVHRRKISVRAAIDYHREALELGEAIENPSNGIKRSINVSLNGIGNLYQLLGEFGPAIEHYQRSLNLEAQLGNKLGQAINNQNIGECQEEAGKLDEALQSYRTSLAFNEEIESDLGRAICKNSIAQIYIKQKRYSEAMPLLDQAFEKATPLKNDLIIPVVLINKGWALMGLNSYSEAETSLLKGLEIAKKHDQKDNIVKVSALLSELYEKMNKLTEALHYTKQVNTYEKRIRDKEIINYVNDAILSYDSQKLQNRFEVIAVENEIYKLRLKKNQDTILISGIALCLLAAILYILYRQYHLNNEKKLLTLEQSMLRSQMNPHFLFNSLNSIKLYIINNEKKNAVHYLNKFSKLVRKILEASSLREIPLDEELETVELYMNIENIRFSNEINFQIDIDETADVHQIKIPSLILQPFLENALWHGLSSKEGEKNIHLKVHKASEEFIHIVITDNGVGRTVAEEIKQNKVLKRKSVGIDITKERLANFSKDYQNSSSIEIEDLFDENNQASGTKVIIRIPTL